MGVLLALAPKQREQHCAPSQPLSALLLVAPQHHILFDCGEEMASIAFMQSARAFTSLLDKQTLRGAVTGTPQDDTGSSSAVGCRWALASRQAHLSPLELGSGPESKSGRPVGAA